MLLQNMYWWEITYYFFIDLFKQAWYKDAIRNLFKQVQNKDKKAKRTNVEPIDIPEDNFDINNLQ